MLALVRSNTMVRVPQRAPRFAPAWDDLDEAHGAIWEAVSHFFPSNAMVDQVDYGCLVVSWPLRNPGRSARGSSHFAAPIVIRIAPGLLVALWTSDRDERRELAELQAETVSDALAVYDPHSRVPTCDVIALGE